MAEEKRYCALCKKEEAKSECSYGPEAWEMATLAPRVFDSVKEANSPQDMLLQKQQLRLNTRKLMQQRKALSKKQPIESPMNPASLEPVKEAIQEKAERVNVLGKYYTVSLVFRGIGKVVQFFVPDVKRPTRDEFQANVEKIYPGGRLVHYYESDRQPQEPTLFIQKEELSPTIDKKAHRSAQRDAKIGNLARKTDNPGEKAAAERKAKGPKLMGERALSSDEKDDKEKYVKGMKKSVKDFKKRYGDDYKSVMYATATKMAKEETEEVDECWKTHKKVGMKMKGGKLVPDCRPKNEEVDLDQMKKDAESNRDRAAKAKKNTVTRGSAAFAAAKVADDVKKAAKTGPQQLKGPRTGVMRVEDVDLVGAEAEGRGVPKNDEQRIDSSNLKKLSRKAAERIDYDADGDIDANDAVEKKSGNYGETLPTPDGKKFQTKIGEDWQRKSGKNPEGGLNEKGRKSYERQNPGSDLKRPSKKVGNKRRASFCARMKGMKKKLTSAKTANDPDSRINKSLRAWNC